MYKSFQGHRGCRGLYPENTIPAFIHALDIGVRTLELDVVVTSDNQLVVSHEPYMSAEICLSPGGGYILPELENLHNLYRMTYAEVKAYQCGAKPHPRFPRQKHCVSSKPLLSDFFLEIYSYQTKHGIARIDYNIEIKSSPDGDSEYHPTPEIFAGLLVELITRWDLINFITIQSFDIRPLQYLQKNHSNISLALLVEGDCNFGKHFELLGFKPQIYSPEYTLVDVAMVDKLHKDNIMLVPWTVNDLYSMKTLLRMGVDGLISDYPDLYKFL